MPDIIRRHDNGNRPILNHDPRMASVHFNLVRLAPGEVFETALPRHESIVAVLSGTVDITVDGESFAAVGRRADIWSGPADSVYAPVGSAIRIVAKAGAGAAPAEVAIGGGVSTERHAAFRIPPEEVAMVDVGSLGTHSHRRIFHILGQNGQGRTGRLLVSELYADDGCWNGYPPHRHDTDVSGPGGVQQTAHDELYHFRYDPPTGFGAQLIYEDSGEPQAFLTRDGDTFTVDRGYHPTVTSPGHRAYIFTVMVGKTERGLVQYFDPAHAHLMDRIPGIQAMREKFR
ncbi:5-deoxy-glucuronate isomerase [Inquilinus ginsengisoli]|uniref:5-deoxy-glucuronate isomerase n=1 Tax=Inquilinus ginsengisoli TaxID=363840 RepID=A0ABU1JHW4_9PROT|nr:5-deoxy-glucuronate isomerase [Inquilinus ginsengisoli]MDR6287948.1 5-deoxy-glucuronate isomerase [Inquilinus ginsengisoli]